MKVGHDHRTCHRRDLGIGLHFARRLAADATTSCSWPAPRPISKDSPQNSANSTGSPRRHCRADLTRITDCRRVEQRLSDPERPVDLLINNAGFGLYDGDFADHDIRAEDDLLMVNVRAVMRLTHAALGPMLEREQAPSRTCRRSPSFAPDAVAPTYAASKAHWVTLFSQGLREQVSAAGSACWR